VLPLCKRIPFFQEIHIENLMHREAFILNAISNDSEREKDKLKH
jgi:hypothetical protein